MGKEKVCSLKKIKHTIRSVDMYGTPITLNVAGEGAVKTYVGTIFTLITYVIIGAYSLLLFITFVTRENPNVTTTHVQNKFDSSNIVAW
jgi:hypothetical protein